MNIYNLVETLHERSHSALSAEERFLAGYLQFFIMVMVYDHLLKYKDDISRVKDTLQQFLHDAFQTLAVPSEQRQEEEREVFEKFQDRYAVTFKAFPSDPDALLRHSEDGHEVVRRAMKIAENLLEEIFNTENVGRRVRSQEYPHEDTLASAKFS